MTKKTDAAVLAQKARDQGFDESRVDDGAAVIRCSQCDACVINGVPCHERGCPNSRRRT